MDFYLLYLIYKRKINLMCIASLVPLFLVLLPHLIWLSDNNYITITYGLDRAAIDDKSFLDHIFHPLFFLGKQIGILVPFFIMFLFLNKKLKIKINFEDKRLLFLLSITLIPIDLVLLTSLIMGAKIRTMWMTPFYLFFGVLFLYIYQSQINLKNIRGFLSVFLIFFILSPFAYAYVSLTEIDKRTDYKGKIEAQKAIYFYKSQSQISGDISFIKGDEWFAGNISYHLKERPKWIYQNNNIHLCNTKLECVKYK